MFRFFKKVFSNDNTTSFYAFYKRMVKWKESGVYPFAYNLPSSITFPEDFWKDIVKIYKLTFKDGKERAISVFWADGELLVTSVVKGDEKSVKSSHRISINYVIHPTRKEYLRREVMIDGKITKKSDVYYKKAPKKVVVNYLFNLHTHPAHPLENNLGSTGSLNTDNNKKSYGFFSVQDLRSLISSKSVITGLVTDRLWLLVRTNETPSDIDFSKLGQQDMTVDSLKENLKIEIYEAQFHQKAVRI